MDIGKEIRYISKDSNSNKLWSYKFIDDTTVEIKWGRIGSNISEQTKRFGTHDAAARFIQKKIADKTKDKAGKRYQLVDDKQYKEEKQTADDIGHQNKIVRTLFVRLEDNRLVELPGYNPTDHIYVEIMNSWTRERTHLVLSKNETRTLSDLDSDLGFSSSYQTSSGFAAGVRNFVKRLAESVRQVIAIDTFAKSARVLDLDSGPNRVSAVNIQHPKRILDFDEKKSDDLVEEVEKKMGKSSVSRQVVGAFASIGSRILDL